MFSPLLENIIDREGFSVINEEQLDEFAQAHQDVVLFVTGEAKRLVEVNDVAVIFPELIKAFGDRLTPAILDRKAEKAVQLRYRFNAFPALVFLRNGEYLGVITRVLDWTDYLNGISEVLSREPSLPPAYEFPEGCGGATSSTSRTS